MSSESSLRDIIEYNKLPKTPEKDEIDKKFLRDEIGSFDFYLQASAYLKKTRATK